MAELVPLKPRRLLRALLRAGFYIHHQSGSHAQLRHPKNLALRVTIPIHDRFELPKPIVKVILKQAGLGSDNLKRLF